MYTPIFKKIEIKKEDLSHCAKKYIYVKQPSISIKKWFVEQLKNESDFREKKKCLIRIQKKINFCIIYNTIKKYRC